VQVYRTLPDPLVGGLAVRVFLFLVPAAVNGFALNDSGASPQDFHHGVLRIEEGAAAGVLDESKAVPVPASAVRLACLVHIPDHAKITLSTVERASNVSTG